jgi:hypothetical protein
MFKTGQCEGYPREFTNNNHMDKKIRKGRNGKKHVLKKGLWPRKLKTPMKTRFVNKVIMFEKVVEFKEAIFLCYG